MAYMENETLILTCLASGLAGWWLGALFVFQLRTGGHACGPTGHGAYPLHEGSAGHLAGTRSIGSRQWNPKADVEDFEPIPPAFL